MPSYYQTQYPGKMEPVSQNPERVQVDKWYSESLYLPQAIRFVAKPHLYPWDGAMPMMGDNFAERVSYDKFQPRLQETQALRFTSKAYWMPAYFRSEWIPPEEIKIDKYYYEGILFNPRKFYEPIVNQKYYPFFWMQRCPDIYRRELKNTTSYTYPAKNTTVYTFQTKNAPC